MLNKTDSVKAFNRLFRRFPIVDMDTLFRILKTRSRMSTFRRLKEIGYYSSYTHTGRYYTLADIPYFDDYGLWFCQGIGFSKSVTLKATIVALVNNASAGFTHDELNNLLRIRVHNTLLSLVRESLIRRERIEKAFLYINAEPDQAAEQISRRREQLFATQKEPFIIPVTAVIEVLIETIHAGQVHIAPSLIADRLSARGLPITIKQVEHVFTQYKINSEKKTEELPSTHLRP